MDLKTFEKPATSDSAANRLARHRRCKNGRVFCHACGHRKPTAWRVYLLIRRAIPAGEEPGPLRCEVEANESYWGVAVGGVAAGRRPARCRFSAFWSGAGACP